MDQQIKTFRIRSEADEATMNSFLQNKVIRHWSTTFIPETTGALGAITNALSGSSSEASENGGSWNVFVAYEIRNDVDSRQNQRGTNSGKRGNDSRINARPSGRTDRHDSNPRQESKPKEQRIPKEDYVPNIAAEDLPLFEAVRKWRNARAREERVKPFAFFNNRQLEEIVKSKPTSASDLRALLPEMEQPLFERYQHELLGFLGAMHNPDALAALTEAPAAITE